MVNKDTKLRLADPLSFRLEGDVLSIRSESKNLRYPASTLVILETFSSPKTIQEALTKLGASSELALEWIELSATILELAEAAVLVPEDGTLRLREKPGRYDSAFTQIEMLEDKERTERFLEAIRKVVRPSDVVVELGAGTGVLSVAAAMAGARKVFAVEATAMANAIGALAKANGVDSVVEVLRGHSTQIELPERADVFISEMVGNAPLAEHVLEYTQDATRRWLRPDARLIPSGLSLFANAVEIDPSMIDAHRFTDRNTARWKSWYGLDFSALRGTSESGYHFYPSATMVRANMKRLGPAIDLGHLDLRNIPPEIRLEGEATIAEAGLLGGFVIGFSLDMADGVSLEPDPFSKHSHWLSEVWLCDAPRPVTAGEQISGRYRHTAVGRSFSFSNGN